MSQRTGDGCLPNLGAPWCEIRRSRRWLVGSKNKPAAGESRPGRERATELIRAKGTGTAQLIRPQGCLANCELAASTGLWCLLRRALARIGGYQLGLCQVVCRGSGVVGAESASGKEDQGMGMGKGNNSPGSRAAPTPDASVSIRPVWPDR